MPHPTSNVRLITYQTPKYHTCSTTFTRNAHAPIWISVRAWRQLLLPSQWADRAYGPDPTGTCCCPASSRDNVVFLPGPPRIPVPVLVLPLLPWFKPRQRASIPVKRTELWQQRPTIQPQGLRPRSRIASHSHPLQPAGVCSHSIAIEGTASATPSFINPPHLAESVRTR